MNESMSVYLHLKKYNLDTIEHLTITKIRYRRALQTCFFLKEIIRTFEGGHWSHTTTSFESSLAKDSSFFPPKTQSVLKTLLVGEMM